MRPHVCQVAGRAAAHPATAKGSLLFASEDVEMGVGPAPLDAAPITALDVAKPRHALLSGFALGLTPRLILRELLRLILRKP